MTRYNFDQQFDGHKLETNPWKKQVWLLSIKIKLQRQDFSKIIMQLWGSIRVVWNWPKISLCGICDQKKLYHEGVLSGYFIVAMQVKFHQSLIFAFNSRTTPCADSATSTRQLLSTPDQPHCYELRKQTQMLAIQLLNSRPHTISPLVLLFYR